MKEDRRRSYEDEYLRQRKRRKAQAVTQHELEDDYEGPQIPDIFVPEEWYPQYPKSS